MKNQVIEFILSIKFLLISFCVTIIGASVLFVGSSDCFVDEVHHSIQIKRIYKGNLHFVNGLTNIPGYHYSVAFIGRITSFLNYGNAPSLQTIRILQLIYTFLFSLVIFLVLRLLNQDKKIVLLLTFTPLIFISSFLVYTEIASAFFLVTSFFFHIKKRYGIESIFLALSIAVRQDNVIWVLFFLGLLIYETFEEYKQLGKKQFVQFMEKSMGHFVVLGVFSMFYVFNNGVAIGDKHAHPPMSFHLENVWIFFLCFTLCFLPFIMARFKDMIVFLKKRKVLYACMIIFGYILFHYTFIADHPYNNSLINYYIHNYIAYNIVNSIIFQFFAYILMVFGIVYLCVQKFLEKKYVIFIPFLLVSLSLHWMVEFRYCVVPIIFLMLVLNHQKNVLKFQIMYSGFMSIILFYFIFIAKTIFL